MEVKINDTITLIGTAHVSQQSVDEVTAAIEKYRPAIVGVELCESRYKSLTDKSTWENMPVTKLLEGNNTFFFLANTFLGSVQRRLGRDMGVDPGAEMMAAIDKARELEMELALIDRDISVTFKRLWAFMRLREKFRMLWELMKSLVGYEEEEVLTVEEMMNEDALSMMMNELKAVAPSAAGVLIDERDAYLATSILNQAEHGSIVAVIGAGHLNGVAERIRNNERADLAALENIPKKRFSLGTIIAYAIPVILIALVALLVLAGDFSTIVDIFFWWILITGTFSAIGSIITLAHPYSIITAFVAAPLTTVHPVLAAGWFSGIVEARMRTPAIKDFQALREIETAGEFFKNKVVRVLLVAAITNVTASIGTFVALTYAASIAL